MWTSRIGEVSLCVAALMILVELAGAASPAPLNPGAPQDRELRFDPEASLCARNDVIRALLGGDRIVYGVVLREASPATAGSLAGGGRIGVLAVATTNSLTAQVGAVVDRVRSTRAVTVGHFESPDDLEFKKMLDTGLDGAVLERPRDLVQVRRFLSRIYFGPRGDRPAGPANSTAYLARFQETVENANDHMLGGITIRTVAMASEVDALVRLKGAGLKLIVIEREAIARESQLAAAGTPQSDPVPVLERLERAARSAGIVLGTSCASRQEAAALFARGYRYFLVNSDLGAIAQAVDRFGDRPLDLVRESRRPVGGGKRPGAVWLRDEMRAGRMVPVGFLMTPSMFYAHALSQALPALWIDAEHGPFSRREVVDIVLAVKSDTVPIVRVESVQDRDIEQYLTVGAQGIVAPGVNSVEEARRFVQTVRARSPDALCIVMIETAQGLANAEAIARVSGVDVIHLGPYDLSLSLRTKMGSPEHVRAVESIEAAARAVGVLLGGAAPSRSRAYDLVSRGYRFVTTVSDQESMVGLVNQFFLEAR